MFDLRACFVERTDDHNYLIQWRSARPGQSVAVYMSENPDKYYAGEDIGEPLLRTREQQVVVPNPDENARHYFYLQSEYGETVVLGERRIALEGTPNFRDLGGYEGAGGGRLRWGRLYRSGKLSALTDRDIRYLDRLGVTLVCDFRQVLEKELEPSRLAHRRLPVLAHLPVRPGSSHHFLENLQNGIIAVDDPAAFMQQINRDIVRHQMPQYAEMFRLLLAGDEQLLIHCASGKDRTGVGAALILDVLGVPEDHIIDDYLLTNQYLAIEQEVDRLSREFRDATGSPVSEEVLRSLIEVRPEYLAACFEEIATHYKSREHFFETALNLDERKLQALRERYLHF